MFSESFDVRCIDESGQNESRCDISLIIWFKLTGRKQFGVFKDRSCTAVEINHAFGKRSQGMKYYSEYEIQRIIT